MPLRAVFFDIDSTLVESNEFHVQAWDEAFHHHGYTVAREKIRTQIGKGADQLIPSLAPDMDEHTQTEVSGRHGKIFKLRYLSQVNLSPTPQI